MIIMVAGMSVTGAHVHAKMKKKNTMEQFTRRNQEVPCADVYSKLGKEPPQGSGAGRPYIADALSSGYFSNLRKR